jgi:hypothetical protein
MANLRLDQLTASSTAFADTDIIPTVENVATTHNHKSKAWSVVKSTLKTYFDSLYMVIDNGWRLIPSANYTTGPASTSTITMGVDMTASIKAGMTLKYTISAVVYYGLVSAITSNLLTVAGAPLSGNVSNLSYGGGTIRQWVLGVPSTYEDASNTALLTSDVKMPVLWDLPTSYLVKFSAWSRIHDSGATHGGVSARINGTEINTTAGGLLMAADATWYSTVVDIAVAAYDINYGEALELTAVKGSTGDAADLCVRLVFVTP